MGARPPRLTLLAAAALAITVANGCTETPREAAAPSTTVPAAPTAEAPRRAERGSRPAAAPTTSSTTPPTTAPSTPPPPAGVDCPPGDPDAVAWVEGATATAQPVLARDDGLAVRVAVYPGPAETGDPWSQWGQGAVTSDGRFLSATGDHRGADGNSYFYEYDPSTGELTLVGDVLSLVDHQPGAWGYGKVHAQMVVGPCDQVYASTYWGTRRNLVYGDGYEGDLLLRLDPAARTTAVLGVPRPGHGTPSMGGSAALGLLYGEATEPTSEPDAGQFFAHDVTTGETTVVDDSGDHAGFRSLAVDAQGRAYFTKPRGFVTRFDPATGGLTRLPDALPGEFIRAVTAPAPDGTIYGVTQQPDAFFALRPDGSIEDLGPAPGYIASLAMEPDGSAVYFVPGAHGDGWEQGTPLMALDPATRQQRVVVELNPLTEDALGLTVGGTYDVVLDAARRRLFVGLNAGPVEAREDTTFGEVVLAEITLPGTGPVAGDAGAPGAGIDALTCWVAAPAAGSAVAPSWEDATATSGLDIALIAMMGHAAAWGDVDGDGAPDLVVGTFADRPPADYAQRGATGPSPDRMLTFEAAATTFHDSATPFAPGRTSGAVFADLDLDDDLDLVLARNVTEQAPTPTEVWRNDGGRLRRVDGAGLDATSPGRSIGVLDVDRDGLADLVVLEDRFRGGSSKLYRNVGNLRFEPFTDAGWPAGVHGLGVATGDLDGDGVTDLVVGGSNRVFAGTGTGLREVTGAIAPWETFGDEDDAAGVALGDVDGDGDADVVIGQHFNSTLFDGEHVGEDVPVRLYLNDSSGGEIVLRDATAESGLVGLPTKAPHVALVDLDNDARLDLLTTAATGAGGADGPAVFMNRDGGGGGPRFAAPSGLGDEQYWVSGPTADVDRDGRVDVLLVEWDPARPSRLLLNRAASGAFLDVAVDASLGGGPGTVVTAYDAGRAGDQDALVARVEISPSQGYGGGVEPVAHLGLGDRESVDVVVAPPGLDEITLTEVPTGRAIRLPAGCPGQS